MGSLVPDVLSFLLRKYACHISLPKPGRNLGRIYQVLGDSAMRWEWTQHPKFFSGYKMSAGKRGARSGRDKSSFEESAVPEGIPWAVRDHRAPLTVSITLPGESAIPKPLCNGLRE